MVDRSCHEGYANFFPHNLTIIWLFAMHVNAQNKIKKRKIYTINLQAQINQLMGLVNWLHQT